MTQWGLDTLFNPAKRFMDEEKRRLQSTREEIGDSSGGKRIDLESGKVTIRRADTAADGEPDSDQTDAAAPAGDPSARRTPPRNRAAVRSQPVRTESTRAKSARGKSSGAKSSGTKSAATAAAKSAAAKSAAAKSAGAKSAGAKSAATAKPKSDAPPSTAAERAAARRRRPVS